VPARRNVRAVLLAALLATSGTLHFTSPRPFVRIVPKRLPRPDALVAVSGAAELACAAALLHPRTRRVAGRATALLFVAVFPANVQMAYDARRKPGWYRTIAFLRLPLQAPLVEWALRVARQG
jgi:uncharacterized membrane protein